MSARRAPEWATHEGHFCGIVPVWFADEPPDGCTLAGKNWFADAVLLPVITFAFQIGAPIFDWDQFPLTVSELPK